MTRYQRSAALLLTICAALPAWAQDMAPVIDHQPTTKALRDQPVEIRAKINSVSGKAIYQPTVYVRVVGISGFSRIQMQAVAGTKDVFFATIPPSLTSGDFDYYVEAFDEDGNGPGRSGTPEAPLHVSVGAIAGGRSAPPPPPASGDDIRNMNNGRTKLIAGAVLAAVGIGLLVVAGVEDIAVSNDTANGTDATLDYGLFGLSLVAGIALTVTGGVLIAVGIIQHKRWADAMERSGLQAGFYIEPHSHAPVTTLSLRF